MTRDPETQSSRSPYDDLQRETAGGYALYGYRVNMNAMPRFNATAERERDGSELSFGVSVATLNGASGQSELLSRRVLQLTAGVEARFDSA
jgi:hypothetical protein